MQFVIDAVRILRKNVIAFIAIISQKKRYCLLERAIISQAHGRLLEEKSIVQTVTKES